MCIKVYKKEINIYYKCICLLSYITVIILSNNVITYLVLSMFLIFNTKNEKLFFLTSLFATILVFIINNMFLIKVYLIICYIIYFILYREEETNKKVILNNLGKGDIDDKIIRIKENELIRFKKDKYSNNLDVIYYLSLHLIILFLSILIGSCVT